jgi:hypothetical protein
MPLVEDLSGISDYAPTNHSILGTASFLAVDLIRLGSKSRVYVSLHTHATTATYHLPIKAEEEFPRHREAVGPFLLRLARVPIALSLLHKEEGAPQQAQVPGQEAAQLPRKVMGAPKALAQAQEQVLAAQIKALLQVPAQVPGVALPPQPEMVPLQAAAPAQELAQVPDLIL